MKSFLNRKILLKVRRKSKLQKIKTSLASTNLPLEDCDFSFHLTSDDHPRVAKKGSRSIACEKT